MGVFHSLIGDVDIGPAELRRALETSSIWQPAGNRDDDSATVGELLKGFNDGGYDESRQRLVLAVHTKRGHLFPAVLNALASHKHDTTIDRIEQYCEGVDEPIVHELRRNMRREVSAADGHVISDLRSVDGWMPIWLAANVTVSTDAETVTVATAQGERHVIEFWQLPKQIHGLSPSELGAYEMWDGGACIVWSNAAGDRFDVDLGLLLLDC